MKQLLITIAAVMLVGCGESQQTAPQPKEQAIKPTAEVPAQQLAPTPEAKSVSEKKSESFIPKSDTKLSAEEITKVLMLLVGESIGQGDVNYSLEETQVSFKIQRRLDWIKGENEIAGISKVNFPNANVLLNHRIYYDHESNLFIDEQTIGKNDTARKKYGIWDAKNTTVNWYYDSKELRSISKDNFTGAGQISNGKSWKKNGLNWELSTSSNMKIEPKILAEQLKNEKLLTN